MRHRFVYSQHAVTEALRVQRIAWRFLGTLGLLLFTPGRNKYGVALTRSQRARSAATWQTLPEEQTGSFVRCYCWDYRGCEYGYRQVGRETTRPSTTRAAAIRTSSDTRVRPERPAAARARLFSSWHGGNGRSWSHVRRQARLSLRR